MRNIRAASRYAKSLLDLSIERKQVDKVFEDMELIAQTISISKEFETVLKSPVIKSDKKEKIFKEIFKDKISDLSLKFVSILMDKGRESLLREICIQFSHTFKAHKNITEAIVISATKLDEESKIKVAELLKVKEGSLEIEERIDPEVIGGFIVKVGDKQIDTTVKGKLLQLKQDFSSNLYESKL